MEVIARGNTAEIITYDSGRVCKLFYPGFPKAYVEHELANSELVYEMGINTPKPYDMVSVDGRDGIVYDRAGGMPLSAVMRDADCAERKTWLLRFAEFHREWLSRRVTDADNVLDYKDFLRLFLPDTPEAYRKLDSLEDGSCLLHGDLHPDNILIAPGGDPAGKMTVIDLMNVCRGPAVYDAARTYFLLEGCGTLRDGYLELMGYRQEDISPYYEVILLAREKETAI